MVRTSSTTLALAAAGRVETPGKEDAASSVSSDRTPHSSPAALAQDTQKCFSASDRVKDGDTLDEAEKRAAHDAYMRALADSSNIVQKYHLQEADFDIMGRPPRQ